MRSASILWLVAVLAACSSEPQPAAPTAAGSSTVSPFDELNALDKRQPVPLQSHMAMHQKHNMLAHLVSVQHITEALAAEDWDAVAAAGAELGSSPEMRMQCDQLGRGAPGFTELGLDFHRRADAIAEAARAHDGPEVLRALAHTLDACTSCHATYRQDVVDAATWRARTGPS